MPPKRIVARITYWDRNKGFGFAEAEGGERFFCHLKDQRRPHCQRGIILYEPSSGITPEIGEYICLDPTDNGQERRKASNWSFARWEDAAKSKLAEEAQKRENQALAIQRKKERERKDQEALERRRCKIIEDNRQTAMGVIQASQAQTTA